MKALEFFHLLSQLNGVRLTLQNYIKSEEVLRVPAMLCAYESQITFVNQHIGLLENKYMQYIEDHPPSEEEAENFLLLELNFVEPEVRNTLEQAKDLIALVREDDAVKKVIAGAFHVYHAIFEFLKTEHKFVEECHTLDTEYFRQIVVRYLPGGAIPLVDEVDDAKVGNIAQALGMLDKFPAMVNYFKMDSATAWQFASHPLPGLKFLHNVIISDVFKAHFHDQLGELSAHFGALNRIREELFLRIVAKKTEWENILLSESGQLTFLESQQLERHLNNEGLNPRGDEDYLQFVANIHHRMGDVDFLKIQDGLHDLHYLERDFKFLETLDRVFVLPMHRVSRYHLTLQEVVKPQGFGVVAKFLVKHLDPDDPAMGRMADSRVCIDEILAVVKKQGEEIEQQERPLDVINEVESRKLTEAEQEEALRKLVVKTAAEADVLAQEQADKPWYQRIRNGKSVGAKKEYAEALGKRMQGWLAQQPAVDEIEGNPDDPAGPAIPGEDDVLEASFEEQMGALFQAAREVVPEDQRGNISSGRVNRTGELETVFFESVKEIRRQRRQSSAFNLKPVPSPEEAKKGEGPSGY